MSIVANDPNSKIAISDASLGNGPQGKLIRTDGSSHTFDIRHYVNLAKHHRFINEHIIRSWYSGALITAGDLLCAKKYFDRQPEFELIYHLRNAAAHGNKFNITSEGNRRLSSHDAYLRWYDNSERFKICSDMDKRILLFEFLQPGDIADILTLTAERLKDLERGILGRDVYTSIHG